MAKTTVKATKGTAKNVRRVKVAELALARSGDKGDVSNVGLLALDEQKYKLLVKAVTPERLRDYFRDWVQGDIQVYPMPNIHALGSVDIVI